MGRKAGDKEINEEESRREIWALELLPHFMKKGIKSFNMDKVSAVLNTSKRTVYKVFQSREDILSIMVAHKLSKIAAFEEVLSDESKSYLERYDEAVRVLSSSLGGISTLFMSDLKKYHPDLWGQIEMFYTMALETLREFYLKGQRDGAFRDIHTDILVLADELFFSALTDPDFLKGSGLTLQQGFDQYFNLKLHGMIS